MERLIFDTGILITAARGKLSLDEFIDESEPAIPAIVVAEFLVGAKLDDNPGRRASKEDFLARLLTAMPVVDYTVDVADAHAELLASTYRDGRRRGPHDLIIAATARATGRTHITTDAKAGFDQLPGVTARALRTTPT